MQNSVIIEGVLSKEPITKTSSNGKLFAMGTVVYNDSFKKGTEFVTEATFVDFTVFGSAADGMNQLHKGNTVHIEGKLKQSNWLDQESQKKRSALKIIAFKVEPLARATHPKINEEHDSPVF